MGSDFDLNFSRDFVEIVPRKTLGNDLSGTGDQTSFHCDLIYSGLIDFREQYGICFALLFELPL